MLIYLYILNFKFILRRQRYECSIAVTRVFRPSGFALR